jgi:hypothetical protein
MKRKIFYFLLLPVALTMFYCSDEQVAPSGAADGLTEDLSTSMKAYSPNVFAIGITTVKIHPSEPLPAPIEMHLSGTGGKIAINWGDGTIEKVMLTAHLAPFSHQYERVKNYVIKIDGEIKNIESYGLTYQDVNLRDIYLSGLTGLKHLNIGLITGSPEVINFSHNKLIEEVDLTDLRQLRDIIIPTTNNISYISIAGDVQLTTAVVDRVIGRVYQSVVSNPRTGTFSLPVAWSQPSELDDMIGPPSGYSLTKLNKLRNTYGWNIYPDFDNN